MSITAMTKPVRPYNEYNIFFQLEREYILQVLLSVEPTYEPSDIFHPDNDSHYKGPCLPSRYDGLVLPNDWYVPGKTRRRKRRHRKSHGAIGFQELSLKIADAWSHVDDETRMFCAYLCDIGMMEYNNLMNQYKRMEKQMKFVGDMNRVDSSTTAKKTPATHTSKPKIERTKKVGNRTRALESVPKKIQVNQSKQVFSQQQQIRVQNNILRHVNCIDDDFSMDIFSNRVTASPFSNDDVFNNESDNIFNNTVNCNSFNDINDRPKNDSNSGTHVDEFGSTFDKDVDSCIAYFFSEDEDEEEPISGHPSFVDIDEARSNNNKAARYNDNHSYVDMKDDEIMDLWHAQFTHKSNERDNTTKKDNNYDRETHFQNENMEHMRYMLMLTQSHFNQIVHHNFKACSA